MHTYIHENMLRYEQIEKYTLNEEEGRDVKDVNEVGEVSRRELGRRGMGKKGRGREVGRRKMGRREVSGRDVGRREREKKGNVSMVMSKKY